VVLMVQPKHPLLMQEKQKRERVAQCVRDLDEGRLEKLGNWKDVVALGSSASLNSIDVDDDEIFEIAPGKFECLGTLYVTLRSEDTQFEETLLATFRGSTNEKTVRIESVQIDTEVLAGEVVSEQ
jgi:hypothetical protein